VKIPQVPCSFFLSVDEAAVFQCLMTTWQPNTRNLLMHGQLPVNKCIGIVGWVPE